MDGMALKGLTVDFHEPGFVGQIAGENQKAFWFQLSEDERQKAGSPWGPQNPQALNRYSYVQNKPIGATDPNGHWVGSISIGYSRSWFSWAGTGSLGITFDGEGNVALTGVGGGGGTSAGYGASGTISVGVSLNAPNIDAVSGPSTVVGASGGEGLVAGGDIAFSKKADGNGYYHMGNVTGGVGVKISGPGIPGEVHLLETYTGYGPRVNIFQAYKNLEGAYNQLEQETTRFVRQRSGVAIP